MSSNPEAHDHRASHPAGEFDEEAFKRGLDAAQWPKLQAIIELAHAHYECVACAVSEAKERGELIPLPRCATHQDLSVLTELSAGGYRCNTCGQFVWPRETSTTTG